MPFLLKTANVWQKMSVKKLPNLEKKIQQKFQKKNLKDWTKWNRKMGGRSFNITSGAFMETL